MEVMTPWILFALGLIFIISIVIVIYSFKIKCKYLPKSKKYPKGHWMGVGIALGLPIGVALGIVYGVAIKKMPVGISLGPAIGVAVGAAIGAYLEKKHEKDVRPFTKEELKIKRISLIAGIAVLIIGLLALILTITLR